MQRRKIKKNILHALEIAHPNVALLFFLLTVWIKLIFAAGTVSPTVRLFGYEKQDTSQPANLQKKQCGGVYF